MKPLGSVIASGVWLGILMTLSSTSVRADEIENRHFQVFVDNKYAGDYVMNINHRADGSDEVVENAEVRVKVLGVTGYHYKYEGKEIWKEGRLYSLGSRCNDDGKQFTVTVRPGAQALQLNVNGQGQFIPNDVWTTSCWRLPGVRFRNQAITMLDVDSGRLINARLDYVRNDRVNVAGRPVECSHYRVKGGIQLELWFDAQERLVRQESVESGHVTVLQRVR